MAWKIGPVMEQMYRSYCLMFVNNPEQYAKFKSHPEYSFIIGDDNQMHAFENMAKVEQCPEVYAKMPLFLKNDEIGKDFYMVNVFYNEKPMSAHTIRYIHSVYKIFNEFGNMNGKTILEAGGGWGGLASCIKFMWPDCKYHIIDLPEACMLQEKYLKDLGITDVVFNPTELKPDLFIAELSISEQDDETIMEYWNKFMKDSGGMFLRWNTFDEGRNAVWFKRFKEVFTVTHEMENINRYFNKIVVAKK